jgi:general secretion pathway protein D
MTGTGVGLSPGSAFVASHDGSPATGMMDSKLLAQINQLMPGNSGGSMASGVNQPLNFGPGGMGGGAQADFDSLIELITTTVKPQTWDEVGGPGSISEFQNNLSLVISQTEDVHEEIVDLLEQLRRNQDLQVTIEVRFITLSDSFFERIGVDFDFNIVNTSAHINPRAGDPKQKNEVVGLNPPGPGAAAFPNFTGDLSIPFRQESFDLAVPQFGTPVNVANFGFAILSDIEAFLLVQAAQGDRRSNVLQAPKVTLFNGQFASVIDQTQMPFVISVIPVVGDFAAAYQPVITVLSEGTALTVQAIISHDRRFVWLTVLPLFSSIGDVTEFQFTGSTTTTTNTSESESTGGEAGDSKDKKDDETTSTEGVTVQLPNFSIVSVTTTVSVPDGGTVLLGGIKRLSEGRNEFGVPLLSKLPYINRLFKNVGIGRETQSLMMMVTP